MLPGGGVEHGEHPASTVVREFEEETGYTARVAALLEVGSDHRLLPTGVDFHGVFTLYEVVITGGSLRSEVTGGGSEEPTWMPVADLDATPMLSAVRGMLYRHL
jgi:8-oxo-dGTP pyrophosphatase MutT (NUDIX family)